MNGPDTEDSGAPNLDCMPREELIAWAAKYSYAIVVTARELFTARPRGYVAATRLLITYAEYKSVAMGLREDGDIPKALEMEAACEGVYQRLPAFARW